MFFYQDGEYLYQLINLSGVENKVIKLHGRIETCASINIFGQTNRDQYNIFIDSIIVSPEIIEVSRADLTTNTILIF